MTDYTETDPHEPGPSATQHPYASTSEDAMPVGREYEHYTPPTVPVSGSFVGRASRNDVSGARGGPPARPPRRRRRWPAWAIVGSTVVVMLIVLAVALALIRVPYFTVSPGPSRSTTDMVAVENAETYDSDGELLLTTVSVKPVNGWELVRSMFDPDDELVAEEAINQGRSNNEVEEINQQMMDNSQLVAKDVALRQLGYDARLAGDGALVVEVSGDAPAANELDPGDVITSVDGKKITTTTELTDALAGKAAGDTAELQIDRDGATKSVTIEMIANPEDPSKAIIGVVVTTKDVRVETPGSDVKIDIDAGDIGGPSAGLVYTLTIINDLTPEDITKGKVVAATGEIQPDGSVGPIGGIAQKVRSVEKNGAEVFLVPKGNLDEALTVETDVQVIGVATVDEAVAALEAL